MTWDKTWDTGGGMRTGESAPPFFYGHIKTFALVYTEVSLL